MQHELRLSDLFLCLMEVNSTEGWALGGQGRTGCRSVFYTLQEAAVSNLRAGQLWSLTHQTSAASAVSELKGIVSPSSP